MRMQRVAFVLFGGLLFLIFSAQNVVACSCMAKPTLLESFEESNLVIVAKLISVEKQKNMVDEDTDEENDPDAGEEKDADENDRDPRSIRSVKMLVEKVYKGNVKAGDILTFGQGGGADCIWTYRESWIGSRFLFYLGQPTKGHPFLRDEGSEADQELMYRAVTCDRSNGLSGASDDLSYLDNIEKVRGKTRFSGTYGVWFDEGPSFANLKIKIVGKKKTYQAKSDKNGFFEIYDLPPGDYLVEPTIPFGWKHNDYMLAQSRSITNSSGSPYERINFDPRKGIPITINEKRHAELDLILDMDTAIVGRVVSPVGKPLKGVCLSAVSTELKEGDYRGRFDCTDEKGHFILDEMRPGNYILVVNTDGKMDAEEPFGTIFYPGVSDFKNAGVIRVDAGKYAVGKDIQIPKTAELIEISGKFLYSDGNPVVDERVKFSPNDKVKFDESSMNTDKQGRFSFFLPKGSAGVLGGAMYTYLGRLVNCPVQEKLIKDTGSTNITFRTDPVTITGEEPQIDLELVFPFPGCEKAKE